MIQVPCPCIFTTFAVVVAILRSCSPVWVMADVINKMHIKPLFHIVLANLVSTASSQNPLLMTTEYCDRIAATAECVLKLSAKYFVEKRALSGSIVIISINTHASTITQRLLLETIHAGLKYSIMVKDGNFPHANASHFPEKAKNYLMLLETKAEISKNIQQLRTLPTWNPLAKAIIFYQLQVNDTAIEVAIEFINELRSNKLLKSIIFIRSLYGDEVISYSWNPYSETNCGGKCDSVYILDRCKDNVIIQLEEQREMFPSDMKGCPLITYAVVTQPYIMPPISKLSNTTYKDAYEFDKGGEINLVNIISQFTNMTLIIRKSENEENWGTIYANGTATGAYKILRDDDADFVIGNIEVTRTIRKWFHPTVSYTQDEMTWCVPKASQAATWGNLVIIFQRSTWIATFISILVMGLAFHYLHYREHDRNVTKWPTNSILMTFSMLLGWGSSFRPRSATFRILIFCWLCFSINMGISYESFLRSFLMHPRFEKQISSEADLIQSRIPLGGREIYRSYFETNNASSFYLYRKYNSTSFAEGIRRTALGRNFAVVSSRRHAEYMDQELGRGKPLIYCFRETNNLYKYGVVLLARKWFPMLQRFNNIIRSVTENGLIDKWNEELFIHTVNAEGTGDIEALNFQHLLGAFMLIGILFAVSVLVFMAEVLAGYVSRKQDESIATVVCTKDFAKCTARAN